MLRTACLSLIHRRATEQLERHELQAALLLYMKSMAKVIPTVVAHQFQGMGKLVDSEQVREEIVTVVDEVRAWPMADRPL